ncbi:MAG: hypothetical protein ACRC2K_09155 [Clostridium sp.]
MNYKKNLKGEHLTVYNEIVTDLKVEELALDFQTEVENDLLDMFLSAQEDGVLPRDLVGEDVEGFTKNIINDFYKRNSFIYRVFQVLAQMALGTAVSSVINLNTKTFTVDFTVEMLLFVITFTLAEILGRVLSRRFKICKTRKRSKIVFEWGSFIIMYFIAVFITSGYELQPLFTRNMLVIFIPSIFIWGICFGIASSRNK